MLDLGCTISAMLAHDPWDRTVHVALWHAVEPAAIENVTLIAAMGQVFKSRLLKSVQFALSPWCSTRFAHFSWAQGGPKRCRRATQ